MNNVINWFEIAVTDMERAIAFYEPVMQVSLKREAMDCAELAVFPHDDPAVGGALAKFDGIAPSQQGAIIYLHTPNLAATLDRVASAGGECVFGPLVLPRGIGTIALFTDSEGNRVGLHQPA
ncbi:VOC family protein [Leclercia sp. UBA7405]|uniref:VOC family protein n=1 Tax=Leclercia sp. UBA7405 TaxID=1946743 RepID=UPI00301A28AE